MYTNLGKVYMFLNKNHGFTGIYTGMDDYKIIKKSDKPILRHPDRKK